MTPLESSSLGPVSSNPDAPKPPAEHGWTPPSKTEKAPAHPAPKPKPAPKPPKPAAKRKAKPTVAAKAKAVAKRRGTATNYFVANQGFATTLDGEPLFVAKGELVHKDHPLLEGRDEMFDPAENFGRFDVEQATAAPGEKRGATETTGKDN